MPPRNLFAMLAVIGVSLACYQKARSQGGEYGRMFETMAQVVDEVDRHYFDEVTHRELFEGALDGMVGRLDPNSAYIGPEEYTQFREGLEQKFGGVGVAVMIDADQAEPGEIGPLVVTSPLFGTPAYEAGILAGDVILAIDGESTEGFTLEDALLRMRGDEGEPVRLTVRHQGKTEPETYTIVRAIIQVETVLGDAHAPDGTWDFFLAGEDRRGYVRITSFSENTAAELAEALRWLNRRDARGLVLDLRDNGGGYLDAATEICDMFLDEGLIVSMRERGGVERERVEAAAEGLFLERPVVVLVNRYSASASEIVSACLQDNHRAVIVGERTWGKGTVQEVFHLEGGASVLKLTTATYLRPSGKNIHRRPDVDESEEWGVRPDAGNEVRLEDDQRRELAVYRRMRDAILTAPNAVEQPPEATPIDLEIDPALKKAVEILRAAPAPVAAPQAA